MKENPKTSNKYTSTVVPGETDFASLHPELLLEWDYDKNTHLDPHKIHPGTKRKAWWIGSCGHNWESTVASRTHKGSGCNFCSGRYVLPGYNDILSQKPDMAKLWCYETNDGIRPEEVNPYSAKWINWKCELGHTWKRQPCEQVRVKEPCPFCSNSRCLPNFNCLKSRRPVLAAEWHPTKNGDLLPEQIMPFYKKKVWWLGKCGHEWDAQPALRREEATGNGCPYCCGKKTEKGVTDLESQYPDVAAMWHYELNKGLMPDEVTSSSGKIVYWKCDKGHSWKSMVTVQKSRGTKCPICEKNHKYIQNGINNFEVTHPEIFEELHPTKNKDIDLSMVSSFSSKKVWWLGRCGHVWQSPICSRTERNHGCHVCSGKIVSSANSLFSLRPDIAKEWHPTKNKFSSKEVTSRSNKIVWWKCKLGHEWRANPNGRVAKNYGCPYCSGRATLSGWNDVKTLFPMLIANEWDYNKNILEPTEVSPGTSKKAWWKCKKGHSWEASISNRTRLKSGCPVCANQGYASQIELDIYAELLKTFPDAQHGVSLFIAWGKQAKANVDIFIPSINTIVEYDGAYWHTPKYDKDTEKTEALLTCGFKVARIRQKPLLNLDINSEYLIQMPHEKESVIDLCDKLIILLSQFKA